jgi:hypothetical protein
MSVPTPVLTFNHFYTLYIQAVNVPFYNKESHDYWVNAALKCLVALAECVQEHRDELPQECLDIYETL